MHTSKILFHNIQWFLREYNTSILNEFWEEEIKNKIVSGYIQGEFEIEIDNNLLFLRFQSADRSRDDVKITRMMDDRAQAHVI